MNLRAEQFLALLGKEWKQSWPVLVLPVGFMLLTFYISQSPSVNRAQAFLGGFWTTLLLTSIGLGIIGFGSEFQDKTAPFLATRPVPRDQILLAKLGIGVVFSLLVPWLFITIDDFRFQLLEGLKENVLPLRLWWLGAILAFLAAQFAMLLIPAAIPAVMSAILLGGCAAAAGCNFPASISIGILIALLAVTVPLSRWRLRVG